MSYQRSWCQSEQSTCSNLMFEVSPFCAYSMQWITTLIHCLYVLIKTTPLFNQSFFQMVDVTDLAAVDSFLQNALNRIVHRIEIWTIRWPIQWSDEVGCLRWQQRNNLTGTVGWGTLLLEGEEVTDDVSKEGSRISNWDLWQQFERIENLVNRVRDSYETWRRRQK